MVKCNNMLQRCTVPQYQYLQWSISTVVNIYSGQYLQWSISTVVNIYSGQYLRWSNVITCFNYVQYLGCFCERVDVAASFPLVAIGSHRNCQHRITVSVAKHHSTGSRQCTSRSTGRLHVFRHADVERCKCREP